MSSQPQIAIDKVAHVYRPPRGRPVLALEEISLQVQQREFVALLGPSGCSMLGFGTKLGSQQLVASVDHANDLD